MTGVSFVPLADDILVLAALNVPKMVPGSRGMHKQRRRQHLSLILIAAQNMPSSRGIHKQREQLLVQVSATQCRELGICKVARIPGACPLHGMCFKTLKKAV